MNKFTLTIFFTLHLITTLAFCDNTPFLFELPKTTVNSSLEMDAEYSIESIRNAVMTVLVKNEKIQQQATLSEKSDKEVFTVNAKDVKTQAVKKVKDKKGKQNKAPKEVPTQQNNSQRKISINSNYIIPSKENITELGKWIVSDEIILTGITKPTFLRVGKGLHKLNNKDWSDEKIEIKNNDSLTIKHKSSLFNKGETTTIIYIDDAVAFTFTSTTN